MVQWKSLKMAQTVANTFLLLIYKTLAEIADIYQNCRVFQYLFKMFGHWCIQKVYFIGYSTSKRKIIALTHALSKSLDQLTYVKTYQTKHLVYLLLQFDPK